MSFRPDFKNIRQDMPPPGGYPKINFFETARARGPSSAAIWAGALLATLGGYYLVASKNQMASEERFRAREVKSAVATLMQAEENHHYIERLKQKKAQEAEIMSDVEGWKVGESVYLTDRWVPPDPRPLSRWYKK